MSTQQMWSILCYYLIIFTPSLTPWGGVNLLTPIEPGLKPVIYSSLALTLSLVT